MNVTKDNFDKALEQIKSLLKEADFVSFDTELTGLGRSLGDKNHELDTPEERYKKASTRVKEYGLIQIGISIFTRYKVSKKYYSGTYCFNLAGKSDESYRYDASSMKFLAENGFDFNRLFLEGLPFLSLTEERERLKKREEKMAAKEKDGNAGQTPIKLKDDKARQFVKDCMARVTASREGDRKGGAPLIFDGKALTGFQKKVLMTHVANAFPSSHFRNNHKTWEIAVTHFGSEREKREFLEKEWERELYEQVGFTHVIKALVDANKPLVGHNIILDMLHLVDKFVVRLPVALEEFKAFAKANLPTVYDTKLIAKDPPFSSSIPNTALGLLYEELTSPNRSPPTFCTPAGILSYTVSPPDGKGGGGGQAHDGGYDAFMTGVAFASMMKTLEGKHDGKCTLMNSRHLLKYANKINFMGSFDIPFIDLGGPDVLPPRHHILSMTCPPSWTGANLRQAFACLKTYKPVWVDERHVHVIPLDEGDVARGGAHLLPRIRASLPRDVTVELYSSTPKKGGPSSSPKKVCGGAGLPPPSNGAADVARPPSSLALKRSSAAAADPAPAGPHWGGDEARADGAPEGEEGGKNLKRLKSVGSELLSHMTLESPMAVDQPGDKGLEVKLGAIYKEMEYKLLRLSLHVEKYQSSLSRQVLVLTSNLDEERKQGACLQIEVDRLGKQLGSTDYALQNLSPKISP